MSRNRLRRWVSGVGSRSVRMMLVPRVALLGAQAPRDPHAGWNQFWSRVQTTGDGGDVLWDTSGGGEMRTDLELVRRHLDLTLPVVDVGCGNGRFTRVLAEHFPEALGVDLSPHAIERAEAESRGCARVAYATVDATAPRAGELLRSKIGESNVFVRGVFHVLGAQARLDLASNLAVLTGDRGRVFLIETDYRGSNLGYLKDLGATPRRIPPALSKAIVSLPRPGHFGQAERIASFPDLNWRLVTDGATLVETVPMRSTAGVERIPGYFAVLEKRRQPDQ